VAGAGVGAETDAGAVAGSAVEASTGAVEVGRRRVGEEGVEASEEALVSAPPPPRELVEAPPLLPPLSPPPGAPEEEAAATALPD
jgi:hypothetical protein